MPALLYPDAEHLEKKQTSWFILCSIKHVLLLPQFFVVESIPAMKMRSADVLRKPRDILNQTTLERVGLNFTDAAAPAVQTPWSSESSI